jgi:hypothetical protein
LVAEGIVPKPGDTDQDQPSRVLLDPRTQFGDSLAAPAAGWSVYVYPECAEAVVVWDTAQPTRDEDPDQDQDQDQTKDDPPTAWAALDPDARRQLNLQRSFHRAKTKMRRYSVRNRFSVLLTLTFRCWQCNGDPCKCGAKASPPDRATVKRCVGDWVRFARGSGDSFPYLYVIERGTQGTERLHVHVLVATTAPLDRLTSTWLHGRVDREDPASGQGGGLRERSRAAAYYLTKYLAKSLADTDEKWQHSYERSTGFNVRQVKRLRLDLADALWLMCHYLGCELDELEVFDSEDWVDFCGPPTVFYRLASP